MRKPRCIEYMYIDFDGFFAAVEEQNNPALHGKPIGVIPFDNPNATIIIAANAKAKARGVKVGTSVRDARRLCPGIRLVPQSPELYVQAHRAFLIEVEAVLPIDRVCSIDELACRLSPLDIQDPERLARSIKDRIRQRIGPYVTCSIGMAANHLLAKIAGDMDKPNGFTILHPQDLPGRLLELDIEDIPGVGRNMARRLRDAGIWSVEELWNTSPKQLRALWHNVNGERFWYALHGYDIKPEPTKPSMFGHGRILPPERRGFDDAYDYARVLTTKAARRMRRAGFAARHFGLWLDMGDDRWAGETRLDESNDDHSSLLALKKLWSDMKAVTPPSLRIKRLHIAHYDLVKEGQRQLDLLAPSKPISEKWKRVSQAIDQVNAKYTATMISEGPWNPPPGGYAGAKIAFTHIPDAADFW